MEKQDKYDALFSKLKSEIIYNQHKKRQTLNHLKTTLSFNHNSKKKSYTPFIISFASLVVAACLVLLFLNDKPLSFITSSIGNGLNETIKPGLNEYQPIEGNNAGINENPPLTENHTLFDVENFGIENLELKNHILNFLDTLYKKDYESTEIFDTAKIDGNGVAIINFKYNFVYAYGDSMGTAGAGDFLRVVNFFAFSNEDVQTVYYLFDGDATAWTSWLGFVDEPITREVYEEYFRIELEEDSSGLIIPTFEYVLTYGYPKNEKGETYGPNVWWYSGDEPDLRLAFGENGVRGYIYELKGINSPEELKDYNPPKSVPLYLQDGETIIGTFKISE